MPSPARVREVARLASEPLTVAVVDRAAHALNYSHPDVLAGLIEMWLDDAVGDASRVPAGVRVFSSP